MLNLVTNADKERDLNIHLKEIVKQNNMLLDFLAGIELLDTHIASLESFCEQMEVYNERTRDNLKEVLIKTAGKVVEKTGEYPGSIVDELQDLYEEEDRRKKEEEDRKKGYENEKAYLEEERKKAAEELAEQEKRDKEYLEEREREKAEELAREEAEKAKKEEEAKPAKPADVLIDTKTETTSKTSSTGRTTATETPMDRRKAEAKASSETTSQKAKVAEALADLGKATGTLWNAGDDAKRSGERSEVDKAGRELIGTILSIGLGGAFGEPPQVWHDTFTMLSGVLGTGPGSVLGGATGIGAVLGGGAGTAVGKATEGIVDKMLDKAGEKISEVTGMQTGSVGNKGGDVTIKTPTGEVTIQVPPGGGASTRIDVDSKTGEVKIDNAKTEGWDRTSLNDLSNGAKQLPEGTVITVTMDEPATGTHTVSHTTSDGKGGYTSKTETTTLPNGTTVRTETTKDGTKTTTVQGKDVGTVTTSTTKEGVTTTDIASKDGTKQHETDYSDGSSVTTTTTAVGEQVTEVSTGQSTSPTEGSTITGDYGSITYEGGGVVTWTDNEGNTHTGEAVFDDEGNLVGGEF